jgi:hypothetical protein
VVPHVRGEPDGRCVVEVQRRIHRCDRDRSRLAGLDVVLGGRYQQLGASDQVEPIPGALRGDLVALVVEPRRREIDTLGDVVPTRLPRTDPETQFAAVPDLAIRTTENASCDLPTSGAHSGAATPGRDAST